MFCEKCGAKLPEGGSFCQECGTPARKPPQASPQAPSPQQQQQPTQVSQNTVPLPPVQQAPPIPGQPPGQPAQGGVKPAGTPKGLIYGLGIAAALIILAGGGYAAYHYVHGDAASGGAVAESVPQNAENTQNQESAKVESEGQPAFDPIRANIPAGITNVTTKIEDSRVQKYLQLMQGDWYDSNGKRAVTVNNRQINGCEVAAIYDLAGGGGNAAATLRMRENGKEWDVRISWNISNNASDFIVLNGSQTLHRSTEHNGELIAGIHLAMTPDQVEQKLGKPARVLDNNNPVDAGGNKFVNGWYFPDKGLIVSFGGGSVDSIVLLKDSKLRFEKSGLGCANSPEEFGKAYSMKKMPKWPSGIYAHAPNPIGNGEYLFFGKDMEYIMLSIYAT